MERFVELAILLDTAGADYDISLDGIPGKKRISHQNSQTVKFLIEPGTYPITIEEKKAYKSSLWWMPPFLLLLLGGAGVIIEDTAHTKEDPQYLLFKGMVNLQHDTAAVIRKENEVLIFEPRDVDNSNRFDILIVFNGLFFDKRYKARFVLSSLIPVLLLSVPIFVLLALLLGYSISINSIITAIAFTAVMLLGVTLVIVQIIKVLQCVAHLADTYN